MSDTKRKPRLLDLFCCEGGAAVGYSRAGFEVVGVDLDPKFSKRYPFEFHAADALEFFDAHWGEFDAWHASPPCQAHTRAQKLQGNEHPDFVPQTRAAFVRAASIRRTPWVIENVPGSPLNDPTVLCGAMFGIETYRHRLFETNWPLEAPEHPEHVAKNTKMGRPPVEGEFMHIVGNFSGVSKAREIMDMPWASQTGLREAIPPAYTEYIGKRLSEFNAEFGNARE